MRLYPILSRGLMPLALFWMRRPKQRAAGWAQSLAQRRGHLPEFKQAPIWVHAASVGEVNSAAALVGALARDWPAFPLLLTAFTPTGMERWKAIAPPGARVAALPLDHPEWVQRAVQEVRPRAVLIVETEIWPNWLLALHRQGCPVLCLSARMRASTQRAWTRWLGARLLREIFSPLRWVGAQTAADAARFRVLGAERVVVQGSLKWDLQWPAVDSLRQDFEHLLSGRSFWLGMSTHPGEEELLLQAHQDLRQRWPDLLLVLAPRHPRRAEELLQLCAQAGLSVKQRSRAEGPEAAAVWLVDTLGEAFALMQCAPQVFMGGSLVPVGGHNLLEPVAADCAVLVGPHTQNAADVAEALEEAAGLRRVSDAVSLAQAVAEGLENPAGLQTQCAQARSVLEAGRGALPRALQAVSAVLDAPQGPLSSD
ncbi:MAG: 3-deoxy-D-manno-octulosonic acid transferase [Oceanococcaceae bacterium]